MTDTPDTPDKPTTPDTPGEPSRADAMIDAVVGQHDDTPAPAEPASAGVASEVDPEGKGDTEQDTKKHKKKSKKPEPTTRWGKLWHGWIKPIGTVFIIVALLRSTIIDWNDVPSGSMEPTILVGDRILVNKMAYALQPPLSGPKIGVPFTPLQWNNPLDGLPAWHWGTPRRGDIVTFWNPVTGVRMVKRIVAEPGDTIELRGGVMTITPKGGAATTATYVDQPPGSTVIGENAMGSDRKAITGVREETLLGETRTVQHITEWWMREWGISRLPDGREYPVANGRVGLAGNGAALGYKIIPTDTGRVMQFEGAGVALESLAQRPGAGMLLLQIKDGVPYINGQPVSYNDFATAYLAPLEDLGQVEIADGRTLGVDGYSWLIDGEPASSEQVKMLISDANGEDLSIEARRLLQAFGTLCPGLMTSSFGPVTLDENEYYMIGDNRNNSTDSRYFGPVQRSEITGEAVAIPVSFNGRIRDLSPNWSRWFHGLE